MNTLLQKAIAQTEYALSTGALESIPTQSEVIEDTGISFMVRILVNLIRKEQAKQEKPQDFNPFLPYEKDLFVMDISPTHLCLLNKYNVVDHHLLVITREFEEQDNWLTFNDFEALEFCLKEIEGLAFYNGGQLAGASQRHKHLQLIPLTSTSNRIQLPIERVFSQIRWVNGLGSFPFFNFPHGIVFFETDIHAQSLFQAYQNLLHSINLPYVGLQQTGAYNLLVTRQWMMIVKRSQESFQGIPVNSLGFSGALLVKNDQQLHLLKKITPLQLLESVSRNK